MRPPADTFVSPEVEDALHTLASNLKQARLRRNQTQEEIAARIGVDKRTIARVESGYAGSSLKVVFAMLESYGLMSPVYDLAEPTKDEVGLAYEKKRLPQRIKKSAAKAGDLSSDF